jgi:hypothetical protein
VPYRLSSHSRCSCVVAVFRYIWTVTFSRINRRTPYGYELDPNPGHLAAMDVDAALVGTGARVWIGAKSGENHPNSS